MLDVLPATEEAERRLKELYGERMLGYGFYIPDCDCDDCDEADAELLVVLADGFDRDAELWRMSEIASEAGAPEGVFLLIRPLSKEQYERPRNDLIGQHVRAAVFVPWGAAVAGRSPGAPVLKRPLSVPYIDDAVDRLSELYGERFAGLAVRAPAPGTVPEDDMDAELLVIIHGEIDRYDEIRRVSGIASDIGIDYTLALTILPVTEAEVLDPPPGLLGLDIKDAVRVA